MTRKADVIDLAPQLEERGWTDTQIAQQLGVTSQYIGQLFRDLGLRPKRWRSLADARAALDPGMRDKLKAAGVSFETRKETVAD